MASILNILILIASLLGASCDAADVCGEEDDSTMWCHEEDDDSAILQTKISTHQTHGKIPKQLVMTGPFESLDDLPPEAQANLKKTRALAPGFLIRYLSDSHCRKYLSANHLGKFLALYDGEEHGSHRGDICRSVVLFLEGGFYADMDFEFHEELTNLIDEQTTFMTAFGAKGVQPDLPAFAHADPAIGNVLNAIIAVQPRSAIMERTLHNILTAYANGKTPRLLGCRAMALAVQQTKHHDCSHISLLEGSTLAQFTCGAENLRFYQEEKFAIDNANCSKAGSVVCPPERASSEFEGSLYGVFRMGSESRASRIIGWSRFASCSKFGCGISGGVPS